MLRDYQKTAIDEIRKCIIQGHRRILLHMATGGGKTVVFCEILKRAMIKGSSGLVTVRGVKLIEQASYRLDREAVPHGIMQGANTCATHEKILVCSIDTLYKRKWAPHADFIIIDEAHLSNGAAYEWFLSQYPKAIIVAVTATPHNEKGMRHVADTVVYPITINELIARGYLIAPKYYAPSKPDLKNVRTRLGDFVTKDLDEIMNQSNNIGDPIYHYKKLAIGFPTLIFCVSVEHSQNVAARFTDNGIITEHIDANFSEKERNEIIRRLIDGKIHAISSVGVLTTGFDCPPLRCLIILRPTQSYNLHIQMIGRGTRPFENKENFIVLDHAGNLERHGRIEDELPCDLDGMPKRKRKKDSADDAPKMVSCPQCFAMVLPQDDRCLYCNAEMPKKKRAISPDEIDGMLEEYKPSIDSDMMVLVNIAKKRGYHKGWIFYRLKEKWGEDQAKEIWPRVKVIKRWPVKGKDESRPASQSLIDRYKSATGRQGVAE